MYVKMMTQHSKSHDNLTFTYMTVYNSATVILLLKKIENYTENISVTI